MSPVWQTIRRSFVLLTFLWLSAAQAAVPDTPAKGVLFKAQSGDKTLYLFGSVHLARESFYPLPDSFEQAYRAADTIVVETDPSDTQAMLQAAPMMVYPGNEKLEQHLRPATWKKLQQHTGGQTAGFQMMRAPVVATALISQLFSSDQYSAAQGIDLFVIRRAREDKKDLQQLETMAFQIQQLVDLSDAEADAMLSQTLDSVRDGSAKRETEQLLTAWVRGDEQKLAQIFAASAARDAGSRKMLKRLLDDRNVTMTEKIEQLVQSGRQVLVVVGAGHLVGARSIPDLLRQRGYRITRVK
ncbi:TraB/GumN family protein [Undibacterium squillarum]|uniref:TraB/GumN family protein n=1 Tax=Undibacterium squillarum TaxID=1131567 RepID=UPI0035B2DFBF